VSVRLSRHSTAVAACGVFAAERRAGMSYRLTAAGAAIGSNCGQSRVDSRGTSLNTDLAEIEKLYRT